MVQGQTYDITSTFAKSCSFLILWLSAEASATYPDHAEVQLGFLGTLQDELEAALALIGHPVLIVALQDSLLLGRKDRAQVHLGGGWDRCESEMKHVAHNLKELHLPRPTCHNLYLISLAGKYKIQFNQTQLE